MRVCDGGMRENDDDDRIVRRIEECIMSMREEMSPGRVQNA